MYAFGILIGFSIGGPFSDYYGKRISVFVCNLLAYTCWIISAHASTKWLLYISYLLQGFFGGVAYNCVGNMKLFSTNNLENFTILFIGIFIAETAHASMRRMLGPFQIIGLSFGELLSYMLPAFLPWRLSKLILSQVVCLPATFAILLCEETPHWLVKKGRIDDAEYVA